MSARAATSAGSPPASATARYIAPVSRYVKPRRSATARATVDLPVPAGPSMAMTILGSEIRSVGVRRRLRLCERFDVLGDGDPGAQAGVRLRGADCGAQRDDAGPGVELVVLVVVDRRAAADL